MCYYNDRKGITLKKVFISQPMKGQDETTILKKRQEIMFLLKERFHEPIEIIDSCFRDAPAYAKPLWYLGKSIEYLSGADVAYFATGWSETRGCKIEHLCAEQYGIEIIEED